MHHSKCIPIAQYFVSIHLKFCQRGLCRKYFQMQICSSNHLFVTGFSLLSPKVFSVVSLHRVGTQVSLGAKKVQKHFLSLLEMIHLKKGKQHNSNGIWKSFYAKLLNYCSAVRIPVHITHYPNYFECKQQQTAPLIKWLDNVFLPNTSGCVWKQKKLTNRRNTYSLKYTVVLEIVT